MDSKNRTKYREFPLLGWVLTDVTVERQPVHGEPMWGVNCEDFGLFGSLRNTGLWVESHSYCGMSWWLQLSLSGLTLVDCLLLMFSEVLKKVCAPAFETSAPPFSADLCGRQSLGPVLPH